MQKLSDLYNRFGWELNTVDFEFTPRRSGEPTVIGGINCYPVPNSYVASLIKKSYQRAVVTFAEKSIKSLEGVLNSYYNIVFPDLPESRTEVVAAVKSLIFIDSVERRTEFANELAEAGVDLNKVLALSKVLGTDAVSDALGRHGATLDYVLVILEAAICISSEIVEYSDIVSLDQEVIDQLIEYYLPSFLDSDEASATENTQTETVTE
jgi:hypothetical protein